MRSVSSRLRARLAGGAALAAAAVTLLGVAPAAQASVADLQVYPPGVPPLGKPIQQHSADWWKFVLSRPEPGNPLTDTTGEDCAAGQSGLVWYLAGTFGDAGPVTRNCTVPFGRTIVIPVANGIAAAFADDPAEQRTEAYQRAQITPQLRAATDLKASIDGSPVTDVSRFFEESRVFSSTLPANNVFGLPGGTVLSPAVDAGYYLALYPLLPGSHTLKVSSTVPGAGSIDVTYKLRVPILG